MKIPIIILSFLLLCFGFFGCKAELPEANFTATPAEGVVPVEVQFTDQSVGQIDQWQWDFDNDGVIDSTLQNPRHYYDEPGKYTVNLTVINSAGADYGIVYLWFFLPLKVDFVAEPTVVEYTYVHFLDKSQGNVTSWSWDFDSDGVIDSSEQNPWHRYSKDGDYTVTLTITGPDRELSITKENYIHASGC